MTETASGPLKIERLSAGYRGRAVIQDLTLAPFQPGQFTALVGPNAAGKSTLLLALAGLIRATGAAHLDAQNLLQFSIAERSRIVGFMPQALPNRVALTVLESVIAAIKASPLGDNDTRGRLSHKRALEALEKLSIGDLALEPLNRLSGGQRQLAGLAQAIVRHPRVLLLDEPTSALDLRHQAAVMRVVGELVREDRIVVAVLHDLNLAARWADHVVVLSKGKVAAEGDPLSTLSAQTLASVYGVKAVLDRSSLGHLQISIEDVLPQAKITGTHP